MTQKAQEVILSEKERVNLEKWVRKGTEEQRVNIPIAELRGYLLTNFLSTFQ